MIPRYSLPGMAGVWSDEARLGHWLRIEVLACEAWAGLGVIPPGDLDAIRERATFTVDAVRDAERVTNHDVAAFVDVVARSVGPAGRFIHHGLTSSDVLDTALAMQLREASDLLLGRLTGLLAVVRGLALQHRDTLMVGRTHGVHAEPTTFGHVVALWAFELDRDRERLRRAREAISVGKVSGVVGTYAQVDPAVEEHVCGELGLRPVEAASQVIQRDRHAEFVWALGITAATLETIALEVRHLARTEVREVQEPFAAGQKGSSAMPHKRNPIVAERIGGLARVIRANVQAALENVPLWHQRDISHSSVERVILPDSTMLLDYLLHLATVLVEGLVVFPERMRANLFSSGGVVFSQPVLLALVERGMSRDDAYRVVQRAAAAAWDGGGDFRALLEADPQAASLSHQDLDALFDPARSLGRLDGVFARVEKLDVSEEPR